MAWMRHTVYKRERKKQTLHASNGLGIERTWWLYLLCTSAQRKQNERKSATAVISPLKCSAMSNVRLPALIDYVAFYQTVPVPPSLPRGGNARKYDILGGLWHPGNVTCCLDLLFQQWFIVICICSLLLCASPADTCLYRVYLPRLDMPTVA